jgi:calcineurin-like phosphoesterase family protein
VSIFFTADHHFGHAKIAEYCDRPFASAEEMDRALIDAWNAVVGPEDVVYHLGDFTLAESLSPWIHALRFKVLHIVPGGHDRRWLKRFCPASYDYRVEVLPPLVTLRLPQVVVLCHYPLLSWDRSCHGSLHLHGHSHGTIPPDRSGDWRVPPGKARGRRIDVGVDLWQFAPVALEALL